MLNFASFFSVLRTVVHTYNSLVFTLSTIFYVHVHACLHVVKCDFSWVEYKKPTFIHIHHRNLQLFINFFTKPVRFVVQIRNAIYIYLFYSACFLLLNWNLAMFYNPMLKWGTDCKKRKTQQNCCYLSYLQSAIEVPLADHGQASDGVYSVRMVAIAGQACS